MKRVHLIISGRVQGVYYRMSARQQAEALGLSGWVRNRSDGTVELVAQGLEDEVGAFLRWCHLGPTLAEVSGIECVDGVPVNIPEGFDVRPST
jgi:acylphosphatase